MSERLGWHVLYERWQFDTNCLASVAIEVPALRPVLAARLRAMDGDPIVVEQPVTAGESRAAVTPRPTNEVPRP